MCIFSLIYVRSFTFAYHDGLTELCAFVSRGSCNISMSGLGRIVLRRLAARSAVGARLYHSGRAARIERGRELMKHTRDMVERFSDRLALVGTSAVLLASGGAALGGIGGAVRGVWLGAADPECPLFRAIGGGIGGAAAGAALGCAVGAVAIVALPLLPVGAISYAIATRDRRLVTGGMETSASRPTLQ